MLFSVQAFVRRYAEIIARVTDMDIEVMDLNLVRVAGTGIYAQGVGSVVDKAGQGCRRALEDGATVYVETAKSDPVCSGCPMQKSCAKKLSLAVPILLDGTVLGVFALACFTVHERVRVMVQKRVYIDLMQQLAEGIAREVSARRQQVDGAALLHALMQATDSDRRGVLALNAQGALVYCNAAARRKMGLEQDASLPAQTLSLEKTGEALGGLDEFELRLEGHAVRVMGRFSAPASESQTYAALLIFEADACGTEGKRVNEEDAQHGQAASPAQAGQPEHTEHSAQPPVDPAISAAGAGDNEDTQPFEPLELLEQRAIRRALERYGSDTKGKQEAAKALGIGIATLYRKVKTLSGV